MARSAIPFCDKADQTELADEVSDGRTPLTPSPNMTTPLWVNRPALVLNAPYDRLTYSDISVVWISVPTSPSSLHVEDRSANAYLSTCEGAAMQGPCRCDPLVWVWVGVASHISARIPRASALSTLDVHRECPLRCVLCGPLRSPLGHKPSVDYTNIQHSALVLPAQGGATSPGPAETHPSAICQKLGGGGLWGTLGGGGGVTGVSWGGGGQG